jgi:hypothetical protein
LFIPQVIYEHGEPWWNDIDRGTFLICPPELSGHPTRKVIWKQAGGKMNENLALRSIFVNTCKLYLHAAKSYKCLKTNYIQIKVHHQQQHLYELGLVACSNSEF